MAGRDNGFPAKARRKIVLAAAEGYRTAMLAFAGQPLLDVWYTHVDIEQAIREVRSQVKTKRLKAGQELLANAHTGDSTKVLRKLTSMDGGRRRIISDPPMIVPAEEVFSDVQASAGGGEESEGGSAGRWPARSSGWAASAPAPGSC